MARAFPASYYSAPPLHALTPLAAFERYKRGQELAMMLRAESMRRYRPTVYERRHAEPADKDAA